MHSSTTSPTVPCVCVSEVQKEKKENTQSTRTHTHTQSRKDLSRNSHKTSLPGDAKTPSHTKSHRVGRGRVFDVSGRMFKVKIFTILIESQHTALLLGGGGDGAFACGSIIISLFVCREYRATLCLNGRFEARARARSLFFCPASLTGHVPARIAKKCTQTRRGRLRESIKKTEKGIFIQRRNWKLTSFASTPRAKTPQTVLAGEGGDKQRRKFQSSYRPS